jgi:hypothetical protein
VSLHTFFRFLDLINGGKVFFTRTPAPLEVHLLCSGWKLDRRRAEEKVEMEEQQLIAHGWIDRVATAHLLNNL